MINGMRTAGSATRCASHRSSGASSFNTFKARPLSARAGLRGAAEPPSSSRNVILAVALEAVSSALLTRLLEGIHPRSRSNPGKPQRGSATNGFSRRLAAMQHRWIIS